MQGARQSPRSPQRRWQGGKQGLWVVSGGKTVQEGWGDTNARKTLINDHIVAPCGLKGKGKGRGRDKEGGWEVEEANSRSRPVVILQSGNFSEFYFLLFFFSPRGICPLCWIWGGERLQAEQNPPEILTAQHCSGGREKMLCKDESLQPHVSQSGSQLQMHPSKPRPASLFIFPKFKKEDGSSPGPQKN